MKTDSTVTSETISARAYSLWEEAGQPAERDLEFWLRAEQELSAATIPAQSQNAGKPTAAPRATSARGRR